MYLVLIFAFSAVQFSEGKEGKSYHAAAIYKGKLAKDGQFPYMVKITGCSASMVNPSTVLTAAHCVVSRPGRHVTSADDVLLIYDTLDSDEGIEMGIRKIIAHPLFGITSRMDDDIALLLTESPLPTTVAHIKLPPHMYEFPIGTTVTMIGWGTISPDGAPHNLLRFADSILISNKICGQDEGTYHDMTRLCVGKIGDVSICPGDSGGPLVVRSNNGDTVIGIASYLIENCFKNERGAGTIFTRVSYYTNWIKENADGDVIINNDL